MWAWRWNWRARGLAWLLHIDVDELFFSRRHDAAQHFLLLDREKSDTAGYLNYEAVPEKTDITDPFLEVELFKIPELMKPGPDNDAGRQLLAATPQLQPKRTHFYTNGKGAVRLSARNKRPRSVHGFGDPGAPIEVSLSPTHFILHYACCGFESFWQKYRRLGRFADTWHAMTDINAAIGPLHLEARDVVATGDRALALEFYRRRLAIEDAARAEALIQHRVLVRIPGPRLALAALRARK